MINGDRVKQAREIKGWTQKRLADEIKIKQSAISQIESGLLVPSDEAIQRIVLRTGFPLSFFKQTNTIDFPLGSLLYRAKKSMTLRESSKVRQYARILFEIINYMEQSVNMIAPNVPRLEDNPVSCAIKARSSLGLSPDTPINNLVRILESNGIIVLALPLTLNKIEAFSAWVGNDKRRPVIAISSGTKKGDRLRFSLAHELGHLVMHQAMTGSISQIEKEANKFAGEFLAPKEALDNEIKTPVTLSSLMPLKAKWKIALQALIRRAYDINKINKGQYEYLNIQIARKGFKVNEPIEISLEKPRLLGQLAEMKYGIPIDYKALASQVNMPSQLVKESLEAHAIKAQLLEIKNDGGEVLDFHKVRRNVL